MQLQPFAGISIDETEDPGYSDLLARANAVCQTEALLRAEGVEFPEYYNESDVSTADAVVKSYAQDPVKTSKVADLSVLSTAALRLTSAIMKEFGAMVLTSAAEIRNLVTNKLILETENTDPRVRIKAMELLGKMTDVGLFTERKHVVVTHSSPDEIADKLRQKLAAIQTLVPDEDGVYTSPVTQGSRPAKKAVIIPNPVEFEDLDLDSAMAELQL